MVEILFEQEEDSEEDSEEAQKKSDESESLEDTISYGINPEEAEGEDEIVLSIEDLKDMADILSAEDESLMGDQVPHENLIDEPQTIPSLGDEMEVPTSTIQATLEEEGFRAARHY